MSTKLTLKSQFDRPQKRAHAGSNKRLPAVSIVLKYTLVFSLFKGVITSGEVLDIFVKHGKHLFDFLIRYLAE